LNPEHNGKAVGLAKRELSPGLAHNAAGTRTDRDIQRVFRTQGITLLMKLCRGAIVA